MSTLISPRPALINSSLSALEVGTCIAIMLARQTNRAFHPCIFFFWRGWGKGGPFRFRTYGAKFFLCSSSPSPLRRARMVLTAWRALLQIPTTYKGDTVEMCLTLYQLLITILIRVMSASNLVPRCSYYIWGHSADIMIAIQAVLYSRVLYSNIYPNTDYT